MCPRDCGQMDCLCAGAIQTHAVQCPNVLAERRFFASLDADLWNAESPMNQASVNQRGDGCRHFPPLIAGTTIRALTQTWLL